MIKKNTFQKIPHKNSNITVVPLWIILAALALLVCGVIYLIFQFKPTLETREVNKIPTGVAHKFPKPPLTQSIRVPILLYHYVEYVQDKSDTIRQSLNIQPHTFEQQVKTLQDANYSFMTVGELGEVLNGEKKLPKKPVILTFDDGYRDFFTDVFPILKKYKIKATEYVVSGFIGKPNYMFSEQIEEISRSGLVEIGAHTVHHVSLAYKLLPVVQFEVQKSKSDLERSYGIRVVSFAYPNGSFDETSIRIVKDAGYTSAVSTVPGIDQSQNNRFFLYRLRPGYKTGQELLNYLEQSTFPMRKK